MVKKKENLVRDQKQLVFVFRDLLVLRHHITEITHLDDLCIGQGICKKKLQRQHIAYY